LDKSVRVTKGKQVMGDEANPKVIEKKTII